MGSTIIAYGDLKGHNNTQKYSEIYCFYTMFKI